MLKSHFHKDNKRRDGVQGICIICFKHYHNIRKKRRSILDKERRKIDLNFKLLSNITVRTNKTFKSQNVRKTNKTFDLLGCSNSFLQRWIIHQLYGNMTIENFGSLWQIDHCLPIASFNILDEIDMQKCFNWVNLRPMYPNKIISKSDKIDHRLYLMQEIKAYQFIKLNEEEIN